ncbi:hypothetical protein SNEBB_006590 [Seison nebaliae]|nr:hypothetical protein SNEBB_006590 [Seison nebaliae]
MNLWTKNNSVTLEDLLRKESKKISANRIINNNAAENDTTISNPITTANRFQSVPFIEVNKIHKPFCQMNMEQTEIIDELFQMTGTTEGINGNNFLAEKFRRKNSQLHNRLLVALLPFSAFRKLYFSCSPILADSLMIEMDEKSSSYDINSLRSYFNFEIFVPFVNLRVASSRINLLPQYEKMCKLLCAFGVYAIEFYNLDYLTYLWRKWEDSNNRTFLHELIDNDLLLNPKIRSLWRKNLLSGPLQDINDQGFDYYVNKWMTMIINHSITVDHVKCQSFIHALIKSLIKSINTQSRYFEFDQEMLKRRIVEGTKATKLVENKNRESNLSTENNTKSETL